MSSNSPQMTDSSAKPDLSAAISKSAAADEVDSFLNDCTFQARWADLKVALRYPHVRARLASHIWDMQDQAMAEGKTAEFCSALPTRLDAATAKVAMNYPYQAKSSDLTQKMLALGAKVSEQQFADACEKYANKPDAYYRMVIELAVRHEMISWQHTLGFDNLDGWYELLTRADRDSNPSLYLVASWLMTAKQKRQAIQSCQTEARLLLLIKHMNLPKRWQEQVPEAFRAAALAYELGV